MSNSPRKSFAQWKLERNMRQPPPQDNASTSAQPFPHSVDLLRNRNFLKPLGPFDGKVTAFAQLGAEHYFITTNTDYVPAVPSLETPHSVYLRSDMRYGTDDPTLWPQQFTEHYCHLAVIAKKGTRPDLAAMWWDPSPQDFVVRSAVTRGLGRLAPARMSPIIDAVNKVIGRCKALEAKSSKALLPLFGQLMAHTTLPTTFPKMLFALTSLQREVLELDALYEYMTVYKPRMENYLVCSTSSVSQCVGAFTSHPFVAQQLWAAGVPFWFLRPEMVFDEENILDVVPLLEPNLEKIDAIHRATRYTPWYHDPFDTGLARLPSPPPIASTSSHAVAPPLSNFAKPRANPIPQKNPGKGYRPYAAKQKKASAGPAKVDRNKFVALTVTEMPPLIELQQGSPRIQDMSSPNPRYLPTPIPSAVAGSFTIGTSFAMASFSCSPIAPSFSPRNSGAKELEDVILPALETCQQSRVSKASPSLTSLLPEFSLGETREIIWDVAETSFHFEFCALNRRASGQTRVDEVKKCFAGSMLVGPPLAMSKQGWASTSLEERHVFVGRTATLMLDWVTKSRPPNIIRRIIDRLSCGLPPRWKDLENAVCCYYTQAFWEHFGRAAVLPMRLDHDLEKEEEEL
ncbi:hypothetical protein B0H14DRAFT_3490537 [Mycena olivaceomarginata]|nr:hypothetical protein B0H14DRAFT_3490537 [Mycena olivaceomarginata]